MRGISVLLVLLAHSSRCDGFPGHTVGDSWLIHLGSSGVVLFFVLSGFLITLLLLRDSERPGGLSVPTFYLRRALRILPAYALYLLGVAVADRAGWIHLEPMDYVASATFTIGLLPSQAYEVAHLWTLTIQQHFYLGWPLLMVILGRARAWWVVCAYSLAVTAAQGVRLLGLDVGTLPASWAFAWLLKTGPIAIGSLMAMTLYRAGPGIYRRLPQGGQASGLLLGLVGFQAALYVAALFSGRAGIVQSTLAPWLSALAIWCAAVLPAGLLRGVVEARWLSWIGVISYSLYLWQQPFLVNDPGSLLRQWPLSLAAVFAAAALSHRLIEVPVLRWRETRQRDPGGSAPAGCQTASEKDQMPSREA